MNSSALAAVTGGVAPVVTPDPDAAWDTGAGARPPAEADEPDADRPKDTTGVPGSAGAQRRSVLVGAAA